MSSEARVVVRTRSAPLVTYHACSHLHNPSCLPHDAVGPDRHEESGTSPTNGGNLRRISLLFYGTPSTDSLCVHIRWRRFVVDIASFVYGEPGIHSLAVSRRCASSRRHAASPHQRASRLLSKRRSSLTDQVQAPTYLSQPQSIKVSLLPLLDQPVL